MKKHRPLIMLLTLFLLTWTLFGCLRSDNNEPSLTEDPCRELSFDGYRFSYSGDPDDISFNEDIITLHRSGEYRLSGELTEGRIRVECDGKVRLLLDGLTASSSYGAVISSSCGTFLEIMSAGGSTNLLRSKKYSQTGQSYPVACILSEGALTFSGKGSINIRSEHGAAALSLSELRVTDGRITLGGEQYGAWARDRFVLENGAVTVSSGEYGVYVPCEDFCEGIIELMGGELNAICESAVLFAGRRIDIGNTKTTYDAPEFSQCGISDRER